MLLKNIYIFSLLCYISTIFSFKLSSFTRFTTKSKNYKINNKNIHSTIRSSHSNHRISGSSSLKASTEDKITTNPIIVDIEERKELWKSISNLERQAVELLSDLNDSSTTTTTETEAEATKTTNNNSINTQTTDKTDKTTERTVTNKEKAFKLLAESNSLKKNDPFLQAAATYSIAIEEGDEDRASELLAQMDLIGVPPHIAGLAHRQSKSFLVTTDGAFGGVEEVDPGSNFSDTVTEKIRVKVSSFYDIEKSDPSQGKFMFWYKVGIYNEGSEPVQIVARMWEIEKCKGDKEVVRGAGIMSTQPIIPPGDVFTYQSVCPLKVFPPKGKRVLGSMTGAYTMCKGNMGQHNFTVKVGKFNLIVPETVAEQIA